MITLKVCNLPVSHQNTAGLVLPQHIKDIPPRPCSDDNRERTGGFDVGGGNHKEFITTTQPFHLQREVQPENESTFAFKDV